MYSRYRLLLIAFLALTFPAQAAPYKIDYAASTFGFSGTHADNIFKGDIKDWTAEIDFDPDNLASSVIHAEINLQSATTGNAMYDGALPQKDWFNTREYPKAVFKSTAITHNKDNLYQVTGDLTLRGITKSISFDFSLSDLSNTPVRAHASFPIDRLDFDIGKKSDDKAEWVSRDITLTLDITATRQ